MLLQNVCFDWQHDANVVLPQDSLGRSKFWRMTGRFPIGTLGTQFNVRLWFRSDGATHQCCRVMFFDNRHTAMMSYFEQLAPRICGMTHEGIRTLLKVLCSRLTFQNHSAMVLTPIGCADSKRPLGLISGRGDIGLLDERLFASLRHHHLHL